MHNPIHKDGRPTPNSLSLTRHLCLLYYRKMGSHEAPRISIIIAGGGIAGLALLRGLLQYPHLDPVLYEATSFYADVGGGMALHKNAICAMRSINPDVQQAYMRKANSMLADDEVEMATRVIVGSGPRKDQVLAYLGKAKGRKTVSRHDLIAGFQALSDPERIIFNKRLKSVCETDQGVIAEFQDGSTALADCLIGADGVHSVVRSYLLGRDHPAAHPTNHERWTHLHLSVPYEIAQQHVPEDWLGFVPIIIGSEGYVNMMPLHYGKTHSMSVIVHGPVTPENMHEHLDIGRWSKYGPGMVNLLNVRTPSLNHISDTH
jgi:salicylate hydroxylase